MIIQTHPRGDRRILEKIKFPEISGATNQPKKCQCWGLRRAHGPGYMGLAATTWVPVGARVPISSQMITQTHPRGDRTISEKIKLWKFFQLMHANLKTAKVLTGKGQDTRHWLGGPCARKMLFLTWVRIDA